MVKFYIQQIDNAHEIHCDTNSTFTEVAGSFNLGTIELEWNENKHALFPQTKLFIVDSVTNNTWSFVVSQDNVEIIKKVSPLKYIHHLTVSQNTHKLNNHLLRNSVFEQPFDSSKHIQKNCCFCNLARWESGFLQHYTLQSQFIYNDDQHLKTYSAIDFSESRRKVRSAYFIPKQIATWYRSADNTDPESFILESPQGALTNVISELYVNIVNYDDATDFIQINIGGVDWGNKVFLTSQQANWLNGKKVYIQYSGESRDMSSVLEIDYYRYTGTFPQVFGVINCDFYFESYYYSLWDVLDTINKQYKQTYNNGSRADLYTMPNKLTGKGKILNDTIAPEFNFTGVDVFTAVAQVLSYIDAYPTISSSGVLDFEYLNDLSNQVITDIKLSDEKNTLNEQNFANRLVANYQNGKQLTSLAYPSLDTYSYIGASSYGVPDRNDAWFLLNHKIDYLDNLYLKVNVASQTIREMPVSIAQDTYLCIFTSFPISLTEFDISMAVFDNDIYNQLPIDYARSSFPNKNNTLYYTKGDNKIYAGKIGNINEARYGEEEVLEYALGWVFSRYLGVYTSIYKLDGFDTHILRRTLTFRAVYHSILDGRVAQESTTNKVEGETTVAQENSGVELNRMGNNIQGLIAKLGTEQKSVSFPITEFKDKYTIGSLWEDDEGNKWYINQIKTTFITNPDKVISEATFTKNFNMLAQYTKLNQEKRFYDISTQLTTTGYENINEFIYFTNRNISDATLRNLAEKISVMDLALYSILLQSSVYQIDFAVLKANETASSSSVVSALPLNTYGCGNQICFEVGYDSPINAGNHLVINGNSYELETCLYTASSGFADAVSVWMYQKESQIFSRNYPRIAGTDIAEDVKLIDISNYYYYKKPSEIFHLNYAINFMPYFTKTIDSLGTPIYVYDEIFFGDKLINDNPILINNNFESSEYHLYGSSVKYSMLDNKISSTDTHIGTCVLNVTVNNVNSDSYRNIGEIEARINSASVNISSYAGWCIADKNGNILFAVNKSTNSMTIAKVKFFTSRFRKE